MSAINLIPKMALESITQRMEFSGSGVGGGGGGADSPIEALATFPNRN